MLSDKSEANTSRSGIKMALLGVILVVVVGAVAYRSGESPINDNTAGTRNLNIMGAETVKPNVGAVYDKFIASTTGEEQAKWIAKKQSVVSRYEEMGVKADGLQGQQIISTVGFYWATFCYPGCNQPVRQCHYLSKQNPAGGWFKIIGVKLFFDPNYWAISGLEVTFADNSKQLGGSSAGPTVDYTAASSKKMTAISVIGRNGYFFGMSALFDDNNAGQLAPLFNGVQSAPYHAPTLGDLHQGSLQAAESSGLAIEDIQICFGAGKATNIGAYFGNH